VRIYTDLLQVCSDCYAAVADPAVEFPLGDFATFADWQTVVEATWGTEGVLEDAMGLDDDPAFSRTPCELCSSALRGLRYRVTLKHPDEDV
jgi:hypothetical protein